MMKPFTNIPGYIAKGEPGGMYLVDERGAELRRVPGSCHWQAFVDGERLPGRYPRVHGAACAVSRHRAEPPPALTVDSDMAKSILHEGLQAIRRLHCDRKGEGGHDCIGKLTIAAGGVRAECVACGDVELRDSEAAREVVACSAAAALEAMTQERRGRMALIAAEKEG